MTRKKDGDTRIDKVTPSGSTKRVKETSAISEVDKVQEAAAVRGVSRVSQVRQSGGISAISAAQRERLMTMVSEEAEKLAAQGMIPKSQRDVVEQAVRMIIDAALVEEDPDKGSSP